jgi:hypothetical protein
MVEQKLTSEEKLLKIIEKGLPAGKKPAPGVSVAGVKPDIRNYFSLAVLSRIVPLVCLFLTCVWAVDFFHQRSWFGQSLQRLSSISPVVETPVAQAQPAVKEVALADLQNEASQRNIFTLNQVKAEEKAAPEVDYASLVKDFRLVGILWSASPQAMVENSREGKTSLLSVNDSIGEFSVTKIFQDKIILGKDGKEWELR